MISAAEFNRYAQQGYNRIPLIYEVVTDLDTPLSIYMKLCAEQPYSYLFESVQGGEKWGRYSIIGLPAKTIITVCGTQFTIKNDNCITEQYQVADPLAEVDRLQNSYKVVELAGAPRFNGGLVGYFGYEVIHYIEPRVYKNDKEDVIGAPDILLMVSDEVVVFDNLSCKLFIIVHADPSLEGAYDHAKKRINDLATRLSGNLVNRLELHESLPSDAGDESGISSNFSRDDYEKGVETIKNYIVEGDVLQALLSQRFSLPFDSPPLNLYRSLRLLNPSPYMYFINLDDFHIVGSSPEILVRLEANVVTVRPIAGTRPRGQTEQEDFALEKELLQDPKELAEHVMLIDLGRNDIGRIAEPGSVKLTEKMVIERYSHVMHIVSHVTGKLRKDMSAIDVLRATFPAGTVSGAPKIRAMEIIAELETTKRGIYSGAIGYLSWNGNMDTAIAIRTAVIKDKTLYIQAGAGIVADSVPAKEWEETMNKGRAIFKAASMVEGR